MESKINNDEVIAETVESQPLIIKHLNLFAFDPNQRLNIIKINVLETVFNKVRLFTLIYSLGKILTVLINNTLCFNGIYLFKSGVLSRNTIIIINSLFVEWT